MSTPAPETDAPPSKAVAKPKPNGVDSGATEHESPRGAAFRRPYIVESESFAKRLEVELNYADNELEIIRANMRALGQRERDLVKIRDAALNGLGILHDVAQDGATEDEAN